MLGQWAATDSASNHQITPLDQSRLDSLLLDVNSPRCTAVMLKSQIRPKFVQSRLWPDLPKMDGCRTRRSRGRNPVLICCLCHSFIACWVTTVEILCDHVLQLKFYMIFLRVDDFFGYVCVVIAMKSLLCSLLFCLSTMTVVNLFRGPCVLCAVKVVFIHVW